MPDLVNSLEVVPEKVMDRKKVAGAIHTVLDVAVEMLGKESFVKEDHTKIKLIRTMGGHINGAVTMIQQETAQQRMVLVVERMKQLGYG